jgi:hypothetical protein
LHKGKAAVNRNPNEVRRPECDIQEDKLLDSIENLDMLLATLKDGRREETLERLGRKYQIKCFLDND